MISSYREMAATLGIAVSSITNLKKRGFFVEENGSIFLKNGVFRSLLQNNSEMDAQKLRYLQIKTQKLNDGMIFERRERAEKLKAATGYSRAEVEKLIHESGAILDDLARKILSFFEKKELSFFKNTLKKSLLELKEKYQEKEESYFD